MIKHIRFGRRRAGISYEEYHEAWLRHHAPQMAEHTRALRYEQVHFTGEDDPAFHHAVVLRYRDREHWNAAYGGSPPPLIDDPTGAMGDRSAGLLLVTTEHVVLAGPESPSTSTWYVRRAAAEEPSADGSLPGAWADEARILSGLEISTPIRIATSVANELSPDSDFIALTEVTWATAAAREAGDAHPQVRDVFGDAVRLVPADPVTVIR
jgi:hypothetical protein